MPRKYLGTVVFAVIASSDDATPGLLRYPIANGGDPTNNLLAVNEREAAAHDIFLGEHVREADTTSLNFDEDLACAGEFERGPSMVRGYPCPLKTAGL